MTPKDRWPDPGALRAAWRALRGKGMVRNRDAAQQLGVSEAELIASQCGLGATRLRIDRDMRYQRVAEINGHCAQRRAEPVELRHRPERAAGMDFAVRSRRRLSCGAMRNPFDMPARSAYNERRRILQALNSWSVVAASAVLLRSPFVLLLKFPHSGLKGPLLSTLTGRHE